MLIINLICHYANKLLKCSPVIDGKTLATAAAQLKVFDCSDHRKIQKFSGHPVSSYFTSVYSHAKFCLSSLSLYHIYYFENLFPCFEMFLVN